MGKSVTLGGDRLGAGNRLKQRLSNYGRSNHNLSAARITSMAPGVLYPIYTNIGLTGDTFDIDIDAFMRTLPTEGPMFGAFKLQVDVFTADMRLYQAILHNNTTEIGFDMDKVLLPKILLSGYAEKKSKRGGFSKSSLMYYLGMSGMGRNAHGNGIVTRKINATPLLTYYDIFKNYYANKQEENAYVIMSGAKAFESTTDVTKIEYGFEDSKIEMNVTPNIDNESNGIMYITTNADNNLLLTENATFYLYGNINETLMILYPSGQDTINITHQFIRTQKDGYIELEYVGETAQVNYIYFGFKYKDTKHDGDGSIRLQEFPLKNIDLMRKRLLTLWDLGEEVVIDENETLLPYQTVVGTREHREIGSNYPFSKNCDPMQGLLVKTYQSDMFNNWLDNEYVQKVAQRSNVQVINGSFSMDALNFAKKMYDHYNRIAITGGTYDGWQLATYGVENFGKSEKPIYHGGMSSEVIFDEVVSTVVGNNDGEVQPLGSLGGRGSLKGGRGGKVTVKCREECIIMVIASLTPRVTYSQGNAWYLTELQSIDDLHKPEFDRIGFQDLMIENMAWWDTKINNDGTLVRASLGKQPAWLQYQTDVDKCYGDFAEEDGKGFMVLQRLYDIDEDGEVTDLTTYIDPIKYNYAFAVQSLTAQNFWGFFNFDIKARRIMSAKQIPNV